MLRKPAKKFLLETLPYCVLIGYTVFEAPEEERNINTLVDMLNRQYQRLVIRKGGKKAVMTVAHSILIAIYYVLSGRKFCDLGAEYYTRFNRGKKIQSHLKQLKNPGWEPPCPAVC